MTKQIFFVFSFYFLIQERAKPILPLTLRPKDFVLIKPLVLPSAHTYALSHPPWYSERNLSMMSATSSPVTAAVYGAL